MPLKVKDKAFFASVAWVMVASCLTTMPASAATLIVNWGGQYVSSDQPLQRNTFTSTAVNADGDAFADDRAGGILFSASSPMSPAAGYSGTSDTFYGGAITTHLNDIVNPVGFDGAEVKNQGPNDSVHLHLSHGSEFHDLHAALLWDQAGFLNGGIPFTFDETSAVSFAVGSSATESLVGSQVRMLVRDQDDNYWLSNSAFTSPTANSTFTWNAGNQGFSAGADGLWAAYNPNTAFAGQLAGSDLRFDQGGASFSSQNFNSITGIGFLFEQDSYHNNLDFHVESFSVNATSVPEPASLGAGITALLLSVLARYRRRTVRLSRSH